ncbi:MAG: hypothetical protein QGI84_11065, partial [Dehalococcoidia bacterium]|nr:hypothetical protein [Dehalococcoidia bacterium]
GWGEEVDDLAEVDVVTDQFPECKSCGEGDLVPLSDFGGQGSAVHYKAWICTNPTCGFNLKIRNGDVYLNEPILTEADRHRRQAAR